MALIALTSLDPDINIPRGSEIDVDFDLLDEQAESLGGILLGEHDGDLEPDQIAAIEGVLNLIDTIRDMRQKG